MPYINKQKKPHSPSSEPLTYSLTWRTATNPNLHLFCQALQKAVTEKGRVKQKALTKLPKSSASLLSVFETFLIKPDQLQTSTAQRWLSERFGGGYLAAGWWGGEGRESVLPHLGYSKHLLWHWRLACPVGCREEWKMKGAWDWCRWSWGNNLEIKGFN